jgi:assimilatory nitrate reductase catalytic subunit
LSETAASPPASARLEAFLLAGDTAGEAVLLSRLEQQVPAAADARQWLAGGASGHRAARRAQVCNCFDVDEATIVASLAQCDGDDDDRLRALQRRQRCGTSCGSCLPALRRLVRLHPAAPALQGAA